MASSSWEDLLIAGAVVGGLLLVLYVYTGVWPPMVVVESGSMMHPNEEVGFGRFGTIDPGDMVFVKRVAGPGEVRTFGDASPNNYGSAGDVLIYYREGLRGCPECTPIIHRSMMYVQAEGVENVEVSARRQVTCDTSQAAYRYRWNGQDVATAPGDGIVVPELGLGASGQGYKPCWSGFITKGDNRVTNPRSDQSLGIVRSGQPVQLTWIEGKAEGEIPWFGLIKLALGGTLNYPCPSPPGDPSCATVWQVGNANAPSDLWLMLLVSIVLLVTLPLAFDYLMARRRAAMEAAGGGEPGEANAPVRSAIAWVIAGLKRSLGLGFGERRESDPAPKKPEPPTEPRRPGEE